MAPDAARAAARMIPMTLLGRMRHVLTSDEAIWWWWTHPVPKLAGATPQEVYAAGGSDEVLAVVDGYLSRETEAFS